MNVGQVEKAYRSSGQPALMTVYQNAGQWDTSNVLYKDGKIIEYNKHQTRPEMKYIDYGLSVLSAGVFDGNLSDGQSDLACLYHQLSISNQLAGYGVFERFYEVGSPLGLVETQRYFSTNDSL